MGPGEGGDDLTIWGTSDRGQVEGEFEASLRAAWSPSFQTENSLTLPCHLCLPSLPGNHTAGCVTPSGPHDLSAVQCPYPLSGSKDPSRLVSDPAETAGQPVKAKPRSSQDNPRYGRLQV